MGHEYDRDKPPDSVQAAVFTEGWYLLHPHGKLAYMSVYVRLVAVQIEVWAWPAADVALRPLNQRAQRCCKAGEARKLDRWQLNCPGAAFGQHLAHPLPQLLPSLPALSHLLPKVLGVEDKAVKQET